MKDYLKDYKEQLSKLSKEDLQKRDLYLRDLALGNIQGPKTGLTSVDKPWLKYYKEDVISAEAPKMMIYDYLKNENRDNLNNCAINYYGNKIKYKDLFKKVDEVALALKNLGVKEGDIVPVCLFNIPEATYVLYALNKIGAISLFIDPRTNAERIKYFCNITDSKFMITTDMINEKISSIIDGTNLNKVVTVSIADSLDLIKKTAFLSAQKKSNKDSSFKPDERYITWKDFCKLYDKENSFNGVEFREKMPCAMILTGGTTGTPKAVVLSNENLNAMAVQYELSGVPHGKGENKFLDIMPPFIAYGLVDGIHMPLSLGMQNILITKPVPEEFSKHILKHKPNHFMGVPNHLEIISESPLMKGKDLSFVLTAAAGGDSTTLEQEKRINEFLKSHNSPNFMQKGYGMTEGASALVSTLSNECNKLGSVGIPLPLNSFGIFEPGTENELLTGETGEICICAPTSMLGYYQNDEETKKVLKTHSDGKTWIHSEDLGYVDEDGFLYHLGRIKRMIVRPDGHNVFPSAIENLLLTVDEVKDCVVVGVNSETETKGQYPKAAIVLKDDSIDKELLIAKLDNLCNETFPERDVPYYYEFLDSLPLTLVGKVDYRHIEDLGLNDAYKSSKYYIDFGQEKVKQYKK